MNTTVKRESGVPQGFSAYQAAVAQFDAVAKRLGLDDDLMPFASLQA